MRRIISMGLFAVLLASTGAAVALEGVYEAVPLKKRHDHELIKDSSELADYFERRGLRHTEGELERYLSTVATSLHPEPTDNYIDYRFYVFRDPSPNAFALPDGQIYINTGMLARLEDEAQLAALIAHEVNHVAGHHSIIAIRANQKQGVASAVLSGLLSAVGGGWAALADLGQNVAFAMAALGYSRELEEEADRNGFDRLLQAGYDVRAMPELFQILNRDPEGERPPERTKWSTHPSLDERAAYLGAQVDSVDQARLTDLVRNPETYYEQTRRVALMTIQDHLATDYPRTALALTRTVLERHPDDPAVHASLGAAFYVLGARSEYEDPSELSNKEKRANRTERRKNTRAERRQLRLETPEGQANFAANLGAAEDAYLAALEIDDSFAPAYRGLGEVYEDLEQPKEAARAYLRYIKIDPDAIDRTLIMGRLKQLTEIIKAAKQESQS